MHNERTVTLNTGAAMPAVGFGVFKVPPDDVQLAVERALQTGYRLIDTAAMYRNEAGVGRAIRASGLPRRDVFVTTKLNNDAHGTEEALRAFDRSLTELGLDDVDLYLIHWPRPRENRYVETWQALERIAKDGRARAIGVSNFHRAHLLRLLDETGTVPAVNQIELHPYLTQDELRAFHAEHGIVTEAWSPLARGGALLSEPLVAGIAQKYDRTPAQVVIRWHVQLGNVVIPKSVTPSRIRENLDVFGFELAPDDLDAISSLNRDERTGPDPDSWG